MSLRLSLRCRSSRPGNAKGDGLRACPARMRGMTNTSSTTAAREAARRTDGRFGEQARDEGSVQLAPWVDRLDALDHGYVPGKAVRTRPGSFDPQTWWDEHFLTAEYGDLDGSKTYPKMPDDNTPSMHSGRSLTGHRRTSRMCYRGAGATLTMPSVASIRRFAGEQNGASFDIPVTITTPDGRTVSGWVRSTPRSTGWSCRAIGFAGDDAAYAGEAVSALLEARRPTRALAEVGDLLARHTARLRAAGTTVRGVDSSWVGSLGYDSKTQTMVMTTQRGDRYGFSMTPSEFSEVAASRSPGRIFNQMVKGKHDRVQVNQCSGCGRWLSAQGHVCSGVTPRPGQPSVYEQQARARAALRLRQVLGG